MVARVPRQRPRAPGDRELAIANSQALLALRPPGEPSLDDVLRDSHIGGMLEYTGQLAESLEFQRGSVAWWSGMAPALPRRTR